jgi:hypothetical protein
MSQPPYPPHAQQPQPGSAYPPPPRGAGFPPPAGQGFGPAPVTGFGDAPEPKKRSAWKIVGIVVAAVVVLCLGGIGVAVFANRGKIEDAAAATKIKVVEPASLGSRPKATDPELNSGLQGSVDEMKKEPGVTGTVGAFYGTPKTLDILMVVGASSIGGSAQDRYDAMTQGIAGDFDLTQLKDVPPGPLGGIAKCGDGKTGGVPLGVCMWADSGSFGMLVLFNKKAAALEKDFISYRGQIEQKS